MNPSLAKALLADRQPGTQLLYGVATATNTVEIAGSTVAVELPALTPVVAGDYVAVLAAGADRLILGSIATNWTACTLLNGWTNSGGAQQIAQYRRVGDMVHLRGHIVIGSWGSTIFTLPVGFRPPANLDAAGAPSPLDAGGHLYIQTDGNVNAYGGAAATQISYSIQFSVTA